MKDKITRAILFGNHGKLLHPERAVEFTFPAKEDYEFSRKIKFSGDDGIILYLIKRLEKCEEKIEGLTIKKELKK